MSNIDITIIIPVKNMEKYIKKCIDSIIIQREKMEIIIIDFGSSDNTINIIKSYNDKRITLKQVDLDNVAQARNLGINLAKGRFLSFIDADDWIQEEFYTKILQEMKKESADIGITEYIHIDEKNNIMEKKQFREYINKTITGDFNFFNDIGVGKINCECWNKIYRTNYIKRLNIIFDDTYGINGEDLLFNYDAYLNKPKIIFIENVYYFHLLREKSLGKTNNCYVGERFNYIIKKIIRQSEKKNRNTYIEILQLYMSLMLQAVMSKENYKSRKKEYKSLINNEILQNISFLQIICSKNINLKRKILSIILKLKMMRLFLLFTYIKEKKT